MQELKTVLEGLGLPVAYNHFNTETNPPFVVYSRESTNNFSADNKVYKKINNYIVELYSDYKNIELENNLENIFDENNIFYNVEIEDYIDTEQIYRVRYVVSIENEDIIQSI